MKVVLPDGSELTVADGATAADVAAAIGPAWPRRPWPARWETGSSIWRPRSPRATRSPSSPPVSPEGLDVIRHSAAHVLAEAATRLYPGTKVAIGPAIKDGFYYDFEFPQPVGEDDLPTLIAEMETARLAASSALRAPRGEQGRGAGAVRRRALQAGAHPRPARGRDHQHLPGRAASSICAAARTCPTPAAIGAVGLLSVAGAYWRGKSDNTMLTRIYGTAFPSKKELEEYLARLEMAQQRDHRKLGRELGLFSFHDEGPGFPFFHPKGMRVINALLDYWRREHVPAGYEETKTPIMLERTLWERSGHWDNYKDNMYFTQIDEVDFAVKPMNCPGGILIYKSDQHSYRDFPLRLAELGLVHRHEMSGVLHGLFRVRVFTQDDAHIYCLPEQVEDEVAGGHRPDPADVQDLRLREGARGALHPAGRSPSAATRCGQTAESALAAALERAELPYVLNPGDGAFYGPKIDFHIEDVMGRTWQCATCQLDFAMPERLDIDYVGEDNQRHRPVMIHRTVLGQHRALPGHPHRALRRRPAGLAGAGAGERRAGGRPSRRLRRAR